MHQGGVESVLVWVVVLVLVVPWVSCVWRPVTPWTAARQASLPCTNSRSSLRMSVCCPPSTISHMWLPWGLRWWRILLHCRRPGSDPWVGKIPWRRERLPTPGFWPGEFHELCSPWDRKGLDTTERLSLCGSWALEICLVWLGTEYLLFNLILMKT